MNQKSLKGPKLILILTMKVLLTYFWKRLPIGASIWLAPIWLTNPNRATHLKSPKKTLVSFRLEVPQECWEKETYRMNPKCFCSFLSFRHTHKGQMRHTSKLKIQAKFVIFLSDFPHSFGLKSTSSCKIFWWFWTPRPQHCSFSRPWVLFATNSFCGVTWTENHELTLLVRIWARRCELLNHDAKTLVWEGALPLK